MNATLSNSINIDCGLPQGSYSGSLLFQICTNDLPLVIHKSTMVLYTEDFTPYYSASTCCKLKSVLSQDLDAVVKWVTANRLRAVSGSQQPVSCDLHISGQPVKQQSELKLLGLIM